MESDLLSKYCKISGGNFWNLIFEFDSISHDLIKKNGKLCHVTLDGAGLMQINDIHSIILLGTSWLIHVAYAADELSALHLMAR